MSPTLMLDPSLFLAPRSLEIVRSAWEADELADVVIPASFASALRERTFPEVAFRFFGGRRGPAAFEDAAEFLSRTRQIEAYSAKRAVERESAFLEILRTSAKDPLVLQILLDEWDFLTSHSWIGSRTRRPFTAFIKAGAVAVEFGRRLRGVVFEERSDDVPRPLMGNKKLSRECKWLAEGGAILPWLYGPLPGVIAGITKASLFYLFDA